MAQTDNTPATASRPPTPEESANQRVRAVHERVLDGKVKLDQSGFAECRWGIVDNVVVAILSKVTSARYLIDRQTGTFWRTLSADTPAKIMSCSPRQVIEEDREWLFPLFKVLPGGEDVLRRYSPVAHASGHTPAVTAAAEPPPPSLPSAGLAGLGLGALRPQAREKRVVMIERTQTLPVAGYQVVGLLRLAGVSVPPEAKLEEVDAKGYLVLSWTETEEREETS